MFLPLCMHTLSPFTPDGCVCIILYVYVCIWLKIITLVYLHTITYALVLLCSWLFSNTEIAEREIQSCICDFGSCLSISPKRNMLKAILSSELFLCLYVLWQKQHWGEFWAQKCSLRWKKEAACGVCASCMNRSSAVCWF